MVSNIANASEAYRNAHNACREIFAAAGRTFVEPKGVSDLIQKAREAYTQRADEATATEEIGHARQWLTGVAAKFLRGGTDYFEGRITELSYMSLDRDIIERMQARLRNYCAVLMIEDGDVFDQRIAAYRELAQAVNGARDEQQARIENRQRREAEAAAEQERQRIERRREQEAAAAADALRRQQEAEAEARAKREKQFDELFVLNN